MSNQGARVVDIVEIEKQLAFIESLDGDDETTHPLVRGALKSLRLVPKLLELKARAREMLVVIDAQREGRGMDVAYDAATTRAAFRDALAALDAGEGGNK